MNTVKKDITVEKEKGRFYTPDFIVHNILDLSGYSGQYILKKHVIDNSCGDGAFLCQIVRRYCNEAIKAGLDAVSIRNDLSTYIHGIEIDPEEKEKCILNINSIAKEFGVLNVQWDVICGNAMAIKNYDGKMDFVLGNPPYVRVHNLNESFEDIKKYYFAQNGMTDLYIVFFELGINMLNKTGILGYITPSSYFNSIAGSNLRKYLTCENLLEKVVDLKHFQAFSATTYTAITILSKNNNCDYVDYYCYDKERLLPKYVESITSNDYQIAGNYYFAPKKDLHILKKILFNLGKCDIEVKNGYATLCDSVFINDFQFDSDFIIPVIKSSRGEKRKIFYPYDKRGVIIPEEIIKKDKNIYKYLLANKTKLINRSNEKDAVKYWYSFGRSQAITDTYKTKLSINSLIRTKDDLKFVMAPSGTGVYGGLYIVSETINLSDIILALKTDEFASYISILGKYKSGGYYTFSSKDVKKFLDYKFSYNGGLLC